MLMNVFLCLLVSGCVFWQHVYLSVFQEQAVNASRILKQGLCECKKQVEVLQRNNGEFKNQVEVLQRNNKELQKEIDDMEKKQTDVSNCSSYIFHKYPQIVYQHRKLVLFLFFKL